MLNRGAILLLIPFTVAAQTHGDFASSIRPILAQNCVPCHSPSNKGNRIQFLKASTAADIETNRSLWRDVSAQLRNRTMPPGDTKLTEDQRLTVSSWIDNRLRETACNIGAFAGAAALRRLNRREYHNTIRDLIGVDFNTTELFPSDGTGGAGFDTNGETLYVPPMLTERYLEAAQQILDRAIVTPDLSRTVSASELIPEQKTTSVAREIAPGSEVSLLQAIYLDGDYDVRVSVPSVDVKGKLLLKVDGGAGVALTPQVPRGFGGGGGGRGARIPTYNLQVHLARGNRLLAVTSENVPVTITALTIQQKPQVIPPEKLAMHYRLLGAEPGVEPLDPRKSAEQILRSFLRRAYRRPVEAADVAPLLTLYDRAAKRGDPFEERIKLAFKGALVSPDFLFRMENRPADRAIHPVGQYELANRLSYFLWSTMPDDELMMLAAQGKLQDPTVLTQQVDRMIDDPKFRTFTSTFVGQWLGTQDLGGRAAPMLTELQAYYTPPVAADLRNEPVFIFERIIREGRSLVELLNADYTYMTDRLVKFYQLESQMKDFHSDKPVLVKWPDGRRAGVIESGAVTAITSHYRQTSPVLRGAWVLENILGTPVPPPPANVPPLKPVACLDNCVETAKTAVGMRNTIIEHRANPTCAACHKLMDPIGFAMENFDWTGRWREKEFDGSPIDASGELPSGEKFNGSAELRQVLVAKKDEFIRHLTGKTLGYALGRSLQDGDSCTVQQLADRLAKDNFSGRTLMHEIVLSTPFRNTQGGVQVTTPAPPPPPRMNKPMVVK